MSKSIQSMMFEASAQMDLWNEVALDPQALKDRGKTKEEALMLANYFEGKLDAFSESRSLMLKIKGRWRDG